MVGDIFLLSFVVLVFMTLVFALAWKKRRLDIIDIAWGCVFIVIALTSFSLGTKGALQYIVTGLVLIWGARLSLHILRRFLRSSAEDSRYTVMRKTWKSHPAVNAYMRIFLVQGLLALTVSAGVIAINISNETTISATAVIGVIVWLIGFMFEVVGDEQLRRHLANPKIKGKLMTSGLWRYTRHPNYFGEALQWWGIFIITLSVPYGWVAIISPLVITYLLRFVSGVPLTEKHFEGRPGWAQYKKQTNVFFPLPPRH